MPFHYVLANLLAEVPGALGVVFLDDSGETVDLASAEYSPDELRVFGAYFGICLRQTKSVLEPTDLGPPNFMHLRQGDVNVHAACLPDGYFLVLLQRRPAPAAPARHRLGLAVGDLERELFQ